MSNIRTVRAAAWSAVAWGVLAVVGPPATAQLGVRWVLNEVRADFAVDAGHPLVKSKFNLYDPVGPSLEQFNRNVKLLRELDVDTYRIEIAWGRRRTGINTHTQIGGTADALTYDFGPLDHIVSELKKEDVLLLGAYSYTPTPLQNPEIQENRDSYPPTSIQKWGEIVRAFARHHRDAGLPVRHPRNLERARRAGGLLLGQGIGLPGDVPCGGAGNSFGRSGRRHRGPGVRAGPDLDSLVSGVRREEQPAARRAQLSRLRQWRACARIHGFGRRKPCQVPSMQNTELSLERVAPRRLLPVVLRRQPSQHEAAAQLLHDFKLFLTRPELTSVSWAWFQDPARSGRGEGAGASQAGPGLSRTLPPPGCMGLIDSAGRRKAVFNAWKIYASMPVDRKQVKVRGSLEAMASSDAHKASIAVWNRDPYDRWISGVYFQNPPFRRGNVRIYRIDSTNASSGDGGSELLTPLETFNDVDIAGVARKAEADNLLRGRRRQRGIELAPLTSDAVRINRHPRGRTDLATRRKTWIARLGMMSDGSADQKIGVLAESLPSSLSVGVDVDGNLQKSSPNSLLAVRVDYRVNGRFVKALVFHGPHKGIDLFSRAPDASGGTSAEGGFPTSPLSRSRSRNTRRPAGRARRTSASSCSRRARALARSSPCERTPDNHEQDQSTAAVHDARGRRRLGALARGGVAGS
jgi:hypothetical protein